MKALSIRQPWAWLIVNGHKSIENRDWNTNFRGPLLIHAGKGMTKTEYEEVRVFARSRGVKIPAYDELERGGIVGVANLIHTVHITDNVTERDKPWFFGKYGFVLEDQKPLPFKTCKGQLGFFEVDMESN